MVVAGVPRKGELTCVTSLTRTSSSPHFEADGVRATRFSGSLTQHVTPLCPTALFLEYEAVLSRTETRTTTGHSLDDVAAIMRALAARCQPVDIAFRVRPKLRDADDEMVLEAALNGRADAIVTHNVRDFRTIHDLGLEIATPGDIVRRLTP